MQTSMIHVHRDGAPRTSPEDDRLAVEIATDYLRAFGLDHELREDSRSAARITLTGDDRPEHLDLPTAHDSKGVAWETFSNKREGLLHRIAMTEIAMAWRAEGIIRNLCDLARWGRRLEDHDREKRPQTCAKIEGAMHELGLPLYGPGEYPPVYASTPKAPCPDAWNLAQSIYDRLDQETTTLILFGSRGRGDHADSSDTDILIDVETHRVLTFDTPAWLERTRYEQEASIRVQDTLERAGSKMTADWCFVDRWTSPLWGDPRERLQRGPQDGVIFTTTDLAARMPVTLQGHPGPGGVPFHFLTDLCEAVHRFTQEDGSPSSSMGRYDRLDLPRCK